MGGGVHAEDVPEPSGPGLVDFVHQVVGWVRFSSAISLPVILARCRALNTWRALVAESVRV